MIDEQPERALHLLSTRLVSPSVLRKQSLRAAVNLLFLLALEKGFDEVCLFLLNAGFPSSLLAPIFGGARQARRFPSYLLVAISLRRERLVHWYLARDPAPSPSLLNRAWFNGIRPLLVAQWTGSFSLTQALLRAGASADRSISYLTYLRCRSYFLRESADGAEGAVGVRMGMGLGMGLGIELARTSNSQASISNSKALTPSTPSTITTPSNPSTTPCNRSRLKRLRMFAVDFACATGRFESAHLLLQSMPPASLAQNDFCLLLLPEASFAQAVLQRCPQLLLRQRDWQGNTPLHVAALAGRIDLLHVFLSHCPIDVLNAQHSTPLHQAALSANRAAVQFLISQGADCSIADGSGRTALQVARQAGISSEELYDFFHAADTLKLSRAVIEAAIVKQGGQGDLGSEGQGPEAGLGKERKLNTKRFLIQKLFGKWR